MTWWWWWWWWWWSQFGVILESLWVVVAVVVLLVMVESFWGQLQLHHSRPLPPCFPIGRRAKSALRTDHPLKSMSILNIGENWIAESEVASATNPPLFQLPDFPRYLFFLHCDASSVAIGACLDQKKGYHTQIITPAERKYSIYEKECLSCIWATEKFADYLGHAPFTLYTINQVLSCLLKSQKPAGRLACWLVRLACIKFSLQHIRGIDHSVADALSRMYCAEEFELVVFADITEHPNSDTECKQVLPEFKNGNLNDIHKSFLGEWTRREQFGVFAPENLRAMLFKYYYESHYGGHKTGQDHTRVLEISTWPRVRTDLENWVKCPCYLKKNRRPVCWYSSHVSLGTFLFRHNWSFALRYLGLCLSPCRYSQSQQILFIFSIKHNKICTNLDRQRCIFLVTGIQKFEFHKGGKNGPVCYVSPSSKLSRTDDSLHYAVFSHIHVTGTTYYTYGFYILIILFIVLTNIDYTSSDFEAAFDVSVNKCMVTPHVTLAVKWRWPYQIMRFLSPVAVSISDPHSPNTYEKVHIFQCKKYHPTPQDFWTRERHRWVAFTGGMLQMSLHIEFFQSLWNLEMEFLQAWSVAFSMTAVLQVRYAVACETSPATTLHPPLAQHHRGYDAGQPATQLGDASGRGTFLNLLQMSDRFTIDLTWSANCLTHESGARKGAGNRKRGGGGAVNGSRDGSVIAGENGKFREENANIPRWRTTPRRPSPNPLFPRRPINLLLESDPHKTCPFKRPTTNMSKFPLHNIRTCSGDKDGYILHRNLGAGTYYFPATNKTPPRHMLTAPTSATYCMLFFFWVNLKEVLDVTTSDVYTNTVPTYHVLVHTTNITWKFKIHRSHNPCQHVFL
ncbi:hypothetical protein PR048_011478 [Dryococelus australis]|uniref:Reverse transcriptase RNase H-like domain-containing protein n=1 Tax=Dryococelus australis TaxID=614101 RepID=A0ABQ9HLQ2_9NEOP|nr:hypothetical protein PR048_011478 [Dryococelus australis]